MARNTWKKISGEWKLLVSWVKVSGTWIPDAIPWIKGGSNWLECGDAPALTLSKYAIYVGYSQTVCNGAGINVSSNKIWTCSLASGTNFSVDVNSGVGNQTVTIGTYGDNNTAADFTDTLNFYIRGTLFQSCTLTQYFYPNDCS